MDTRHRIDYVYILGASHSGSTLLAMLLNAHPDVVSVGETSPGNMGNMGDYRCSCGELLEDCPFWADVARKIREEHPAFRLDRFGTKFEFPASCTINRLLRLEYRGVVFEFLRDMVLRVSPRWQKERMEIASCCYCLASVVLAQSGARVFVDSSKLAHRLKFLLDIPELHIKVIHLVRDGRAVALTYMRQDDFADTKEPALRRGGSGMAGEPTTVSLPIERAAEEWRRCLRSAEHILARLDPSQWMQVHYEELCRCPQRTLADIYDFINVESACADADFRAVDNHVIGNGMRLDATSEICLDERWREVLTDHDLRAFDVIAGKMNRRYGYE